MQFSNQNTQKHHFIPVFYLKNFTNSNNLFYIYLVNEKKFKQSGKLFHPSSHFYEKYSNTIEIKQIKSDFLETKFYQNIDDMTSHVFEKMRQNPEAKNLGLGPLDGVKLDWFFGNIFWRNPSNEDLLKSLCLNSDLKSLGIKLVDKNGKVVNENSSFLKDSPEFYKFLKAHLPLGFFKNNDYDKLLYHQITYELGNLPLFIGDNPIINLEEIKGFKFSEKYIAPLSGNTIFIKAKGFKNNSNSFVRILLDLYQLKNANKYVACTNKLYIEQLETLWSTSYRNLSELREEINYILIE